MLAVLHNFASCVDCNDMLDHACAVSIMLAGQAECRPVLINGGVFAATAAVLAHECSFASASAEAVDVPLLQSSLLLLEELVKERDVPGGSAAAKRTAAAALAGVRAKAVAEGVPAALVAALRALAAAGGAVHVMAIARRVQAMLH